MFIGLPQPARRRFDASLAAFEKAHELSPNDATSPTTSASRASRPATCEQGLRDIDVALALAPDNTHALGMQLQCAWFDGDLPRAASYLQASDARLPVVQGLQACSC
jgi:hypothetical protein